MNKIDKDFQRIYEYVDKVKLMISWKSVVLKPQF